MKKSEVLNEIANIIHLYRRSTQTATSDDIAYLVLKRIEELGMLPPIMYRELIHGQGELFNEWEYETAIEQAGNYLGSVANKQLIEDLENDLNNPDLWDENGDRK